MNVKNIVILEEVSTDIKVAQEFYENQNRGLGNYFKDSIISDIESLWLYGGIHAKVFGFYRLLSKIFPFGIYYDIKDETVIIVAILDLRQNPINISHKMEKRKNNE